MSTAIIYNAQTHWRKIEGKALTKIVQYKFHMMFCLYLETRQLGMYLLENSKMFEVFIKVSKFQLKGTDTLGRSYHLTKEKKFETSWCIAAHSNPSEKGSTPLKSKFFPFREDPF